MTEIYKKYTEDTFKNILHKKIWGLKKRTIEDCDFILFFCFIVSRAGTDINAALNELNNFQVLKPVVFVVLHHTFDAEKVIPDSNAVVKSHQIFVVDCLFNEDAGLMTCRRNKDAVDQIAEHLKSRKLAAYACLNDQDEENCFLIPSAEPRWKKCLKNKRLWVCMGIFLLLVFLLVFFLS